MAEEVIARILSISKSTEPLVEINSLSSFEAHDREQDLVSDDREGVVTAQEKGGMQWI